MAEAGVLAGRLNSDLRDVTRSQSLTRTYFSSSGMAMLNVVLLQEIDHLRNCYLNSKSV